MPPLGYALLSNSWWSAMDTDSLAFRILDWALLLATIGFGILLAFVTLSLTYIH